MRKRPKVDYPEAERPEGGRRECLRLPTIGSLQRAPLLLGEHNAGAFPRKHEGHHQIVVAAGRRSILNQPGRERPGRVRQELMDEGIIAQQRDLLALKREDHPVEPLPLTHRRGGKRMHRHGEIASELFGERIAYGGAFGHNRPDTETLAPRALIRARCR